MVICKDSHGRLWFGTYYLDRFISLKCSPDAIKLFPNAKEITESFGLFAEVRRQIVKHKRADLGDSTIKLISVGDGTTPRTAGLFAYLTNWQCISIDPNLRDTDDDHVPWNIRHLTLIKDKIENVKIECDRAIVVCCHSHASLQDTFNSIVTKRWKAIFNMPCCIKPDVQFKPTYIKEDINIHSEKNRIDVYLPDEWTYIPTESYYGD